MQQIGMRACGLLIPARPTFKYQNKKIPYTNWIELAAPMSKGYINTWKVILASKWLGSPPFISHNKVIWKGWEQPQVLGTYDHHG